MWIGDALDICRERYKEGMWITNSRCKEPRYVYGRIDFSEYAAAIVHRGSGYLWYKDEFAEIVDKPLTSKFYYLGED